VCVRMVVDNDGDEGDDDHDDDDSDPAEVKEAAGFFDE
jgi:hypothetical protein